MHSHPLNRPLVIALALPAAILIAGVAAILDYVFPRGSWLSFLAAMLPMALVIAGVMAGFIAACDKCESWLTPIPHAVGGARSAGRHFHPRWNGFLLPIRRMAQFSSHVGDCGHS